MYKRYPDAAHLAVCVDLLQAWVVRVLEAKWFNPRVRLCEWTDGRDRGRRRVRR